MKIGKVSESVLKRSILKPIKQRRKEVITSAAIGSDCAVFAFSDKDNLITSTHILAGRDLSTIRKGIMSVVNNLAAKGGKAIGVQIGLLLPDTIFESIIRKIMEQAESICEEFNIQITGGHTTVSSKVEEAVISITGIGRIQKGKDYSLKNIRAGMDIVVSKWIGLKGTADIAKQKEEELRTRYPSYLIDEAKTYEQFWSVVPEAATAVRSGVCAMHDGSEGGIFAAFWELAEGAGVGLEIDLKKLPIRQETIEVCEFFDINPYELHTGGSLIMVTENGEELVRLLKEENIMASVVGTIREGNDRVVINNDEIRFLERPKTDGIYSII